MYHVLSWFVLSAAAASARRNPFNKRTISGNIWARPQRFSTLYKALELTGLNTFLECSDYCELYTIFAPQDDAFDEFENLHWFDNNQYVEHLKQLMLYHLVSGRIYAEDFEDGEVYPTLLQGQSLVASVSVRAAVRLNDDVTISGFRFWARNGLIQGVDGVLLPQFAKETVLDVVKSRAKDFFFLLKQSGVYKLLEDHASPMTILAPLDSAFGNSISYGDVDAIKAFIQYHVIPNLVLKAETIDAGTVYTNSAGTQVVLAQNDIVISDVLGSNGIVHFINHTLAPIATLWDLVSLYPQLGNFRTAIISANLNETLQAPGPMTLFAPMNEAMKSFLALEEKDLLYHIVNGQHRLRELPGKVLRSASGDNLLIDKLLNGDIVLNGQIVVTSSFDQQASNGVLYMIAERLQRPIDLLKTAANRGMTSFANALEVSNLKFDEGTYTVFGWSNNAWSRFEDAEMILTDPDRLRKLILYHVVPELLVYSNLNEGSYTTLLEEDIKVQYDFTAPGPLFDVRVNGAYIFGLDFFASNGCLHRISQVLVPPDF